MFLFFWSSPARLFWSIKIFNIRETSYLLLLKIKCFQLLVKFLLIIVVIRIQRRRTCTQGGPRTRKWRLLPNGSYSWGFPPYILLQNLHAPINKLPWLK